MFATPFVLVFQRAGDGIKNFEIFVDMCFAIDTVLNFFKLGPGQKEEDFKQIRINYIMGLFWFDLVASFPGLITLER